MRRRDIRTFLMTTILIWLGLVGLWFASFSLERSGLDEDAETEDPTPIALLPQLSAVASVRHASPTTNVQSVEDEDKTPEEPEPPEPVYSWYEVRSGDTLERIARRQYGTGTLYARIHEANRGQLPDPDRLSLGQRLLIPGKTGPIITAEEALALEAPLALPAEEDVVTVDDADRPVEYVVQKGDTLWRIAKRFYSTPGAWKRLYDANRSVIDDPDHIKPGTRLYLP